MTSSTGLSVEEVIDRAGFDALQAEWSGLLGRCEQAVPFLTHEWFGCLLDAYPDRPLRLLVVREGGEAVALAPLWRYRRRMRGIPLEIVGFITGPETPLVDFIIRPDRREEVLAAILSHLRGSARSWDLLVLNQWPEDSPNGALLESLHRASGGRLVTAPASITPVTPIRGTWEEFLKTRSPLFRKSRRGILNRMARRGGANVELVREDPGGKALGEVFELARRSWKQREGVAITSRADATRFFSRLTDVAGRKGWLLLWLLRVDGALAAMEYDLAHDGIVYALRTDYDEAANQLAPGSYLEYHLLNRLFAEGYREYHAGPGLNPYKLRWADRLARNVTVTLCSDRPAALAWALVEGPVARGWRRLRGGERATAGREGWRAEADAESTAPPGTRLPLAAVHAARWTGLLALASVLSDRCHAARGPDGRLRFPYVRRYRGDRFQIFVYHRVNDERAPFFRGMAVRDFTAQMELLKERCRVFPLSDLAEGAARGELPPRAVGITFDDGYRDNYENALPVLRRLGMPATLFLTVGPLETGAPLWHDRVFDAFTRSQADALLWGTERLAIDTWSGRGAVLRTVLTELRRALPEARDAQITRLLELLGVDEDPGLAGRMLDWKGVRAMAEAGVEIGAHTVTHPILTRLSHAEVREEVTRSKQRIEERLGRPVRWFAYPNGTREDFNDGIKSILRDAGFSGALTTLWGGNDRRTDPFELKRIGLWERDRDRSLLRLTWNQFAA